tara:strand:+ start:454 stop:609 length:156 start_codon:yes stop_codon:yes gene_type:complete
MKNKRKSIGHCNHMSAKDGVQFYSDLLAKKKIITNGAAHSRLNQLKIKIGL